MIIFDYITTNYITLLILATIIVMTIVNSKNNIKGTKMIHTMVFVSFIISIAEYFEVWVDTYNKSYRLLYYKAAIVYCLYPLLAMLFLYMTESLKHRHLITIPLIINIVITAIDITGTGMVYHYDVDHHYEGGPLSWLPELVETFYVIIMVVHSYRYLKVKNWSKGIIVMFMAFCVFLTQLMNDMNLSVYYMPAVAGLEILTYYFYLSAIQNSEIRDALAQKEILLERNKSNLLLAQIRPHFINSNLAVIRSLCYEDSEKAVEMIDHFSTYLRENIKQIDDERLVPFDNEMESVDNYLYLEKQRFQDRIEVKKDLAFTDFNVPPLAIQTIVDNSIRHGISMTGVKGTIWISSRKAENEIIVIVKDNGQGFDPEVVKSDGMNHVGIKNVKDRFSRILEGRVEVESKPGEGTTVTFHIPHNEFTGVEES